MCVLNGEWIYSSLALFIAGRSEYEERFDNAIPYATYVGYLCFANNAQAHTRIGRTCTHVPSIDCTGRITRNNDGVHGDIRVTLISALRQTDDARCVKCYWFTLQAEWVSIFDFRVGTVVTFSVGFEPAQNSNLNTQSYAIDLLYTFKFGFSYSYTHNTISKKFFLITVHY